jgi:uncharacterized protein YegP (UPF0339 family)
MDMIGGAEILRRRIEARRKGMTEEAQNEGQSGEDELQSEESNVTALEAFQGNDDQWYWHGKAGNGEIVAQGEGMNSRENAVRAAEDAFPGIPVTVTTVVNEGGDESITMDDAERGEALPTEAELADEMATEEEAGQTRADEEADAEGDEA